MKRNTQIGILVAAVILVVYVLSYLLFRPLVAPGSHETKILAVTARVETAPGSGPPGFGKRMADFIYVLPLAIDRWTTKSDVSFADHTVTFYIEAGFKHKAGSKP